MVVRNLTSEKFMKGFINTFDLVNYAIKLAHEDIAAGRDPDESKKIKNRAYQILQRIATGKDKPEKPVDQEER